jgi:hypothetical protein
VKVRRLTEAGRARFREWLEQRKSGEHPPAELLDGTIHTEVVFDDEIDQDRQFDSRFSFGEYLVATFGHHDPHALLAQRNDGMWDWLTVAYFDQVGRKISKFWHYTVTRRGHAGSLAYRHLVRTAYEMYWRHGANSLVMLHVDMATSGEMAEQLTSRQDVAYHRGYISAAKALYIKDGRLVRGAAGRVKPVAKRRPGETSGRGGAARLALAVRRLSRTYDTHVLAVSDMTGLLPAEFRAFVQQRAPS